MLKCAVLVRREKFYLCLYGKHCTHITDHCSLLSLSLFSPTMSVHLQMKPAFKGLCVFLLGTTIKLGLRKSMHIAVAR